jgi:hypothetical protein
MRRDRTFHLGKQRYCKITAAKKVPLDQFALFG